MSRVIKKIAPFIATLDRLIYIKRGYSLLKHLVPFAIASLLLVITSLPDDNLLLKLINVLKQSWAWLPAGLLTLVASTVYFAFTYAQVRQAYLWVGGLWKRTIFTSITYLTICTLLAYGVLWFAKSQPASWNTIWACYLLAALSLTGIGWATPGKWIESLGINAPNYTQARNYAIEFLDLVEKVRKKPSGTESDVKIFIEVADNLTKELRTNMKLEPEWAKSPLEVSLNNIRLLIEQTEKGFPLDKKRDVERFAIACKYQLESQYSEFIQALKDVVRDCQDWKLS